MPNFYPRSKEELEEDWERCDKCNRLVHKGDLREMNNGDVVCDVCSDYYNEEGEYDG